METLTIDDIDVNNDLQVLLYIFSDIYWDFDEISSNPNLSIKIIRKLKDILDWNKITLNSSITEDDIINNPDLYWNWKILSGNIKTVFYEENSRNIDNLIRNSMYKNTIQLLNKLPEKNWNFNYLSYNTNLDLEFIKANKNKKWNLIVLSKNPVITFDFVRHNLDISWSFTGLSENPNITWEIISNHPEYKWYNYSVCKNPNLTWRIVYENRNNKLFENIGYLENNLFSHHPVLKIRNENKNKIKYISRILKVDIRLYNDIINTIIKF